MSELTAKQARFCEEYLIDLNATQAAIRAGYSPDTAGSQGHDLLKKPEMQEEITRLQAERSRATKIDAQWLLDRLAAEADADVNELYDEFGAVRPISEWPLMFRKGLVQGIEVEEEWQEIDDPDQDFDDPDTPRKRKKIRKAVGRVVKFKLDSRVKRLELIGRHIGVQAFKENVSLSGTVGIANIDPTDLSDEQLLALATIKLPTR